MSIRVFVVVVVTHNSISVWYVDIDMISSTNYPYEISLPLGEIVYNGFLSMFVWMIEIHTINAVY